MRVLHVDVCCMRHTQICLSLNVSQALIWAGKPDHWPVSNIWRPGNYLCKSHPIKRKTNKGGLVKQAPFYTTLHLETVTERAQEIGKSWAIVLSMNVPNFLTSSFILLQVVYIDSFSLQKQLLRFPHTHKAVLFLLKIDNRGKWSHLQHA